MSFVYFGSTNYDKLKIKIEKPANLIEISLSSEHPEFLNLGRIEFTRNDELNTPINVFDFDHQASFWLSSRAGNDERTEATFEVSKGADIHSKKEMHPKLTIKLKKLISNCTLNIENRSDYYGIRSSTIKIEMFARDYSSPENADSKVYSATLMQAIPKVKKIVQNYFIGNGSDDLSDEDIRIGISRFIDTQRSGIDAHPWNMAMGVTELASSSAGRESINIWAAFLIAQYLKTGDTSILNILNPEDHGRLEKLLESIDHYSLSLGLNFDSGKILLDKAKRLVKESKWRLAQRVFSILYDIDPDNLEYIYGLAESLDSLKKHDEAKALYEKAVRNSPKLKPAHIQMLSANHKRIRPRIEMFDFISENINEIRRRGSESLARIDDLSSNKVFCYWAQGFESAPPIIPACQRQLRKFTPPESVVLLHENNIRNFISIPEFVKNKLSTRSAFFSDILRLLLLSRYGGTWIDATCYLTDNLDVDHRSTTGRFTAFKVGPSSTLSVWYLKARNDSWIVHLWKEAMLMYWENYDEAINYFIFHHVFEALYRIDERFRKERDQVPQLPSSKPHEWYFKLSEDFDPEAFKSICDSSNIHKLTYKTNPQMDRPESFYAYAVRGF